MSQITVHLSTKSVFYFNEIWHVVRGRWVMHNGMTLSKVKVMSPWKLNICCRFCLSHTGIVSKRLNVWSRKQCHMIVQGSSFLTPMVVGGWPPSPEICAQSDPPPFKHHNFNQYVLILPQPRELWPITTFWGLQSYYSNGLT